MLQSQPAKAVSPREVIESSLHAFSARDEAALARLIHPDGVFNLRSSDHQVRGVNGIRAYVEQRRERIVNYTISQWVELGPRTCVLAGRLQHQAETGIRDSPVAWRVEVRDGMLWRIDVHETLADALSSEVTNTHPPGR